MRLLVCLIASAALHAVFFEFRSVKLSIPALSISLEPKSVDLQIRTLAKKESIAPLPLKEQPKSAPTPKPRKPSQKPKRHQKKVRQEKPKPRHTPKAVEPPKEDSLPTREIEEREYLSTAEERPRLVERAEYLSNPPPEYPNQARRRRHEGTVTLLVNIDAKGSVETLQIQKSSGFSSLDRAAKKAVANWRFTPAIIGNREVSSKVVVPVTFQLTK